MTEPRPDCPSLDLDPFSREFLSDPYPYHERLREAGPVLWLDPHGIVAMARYAEVRDALQDWKTFCSSRGAGLTDFAREKPWRPPSIILEADPPLHTRTRGVLSKVLARGALERFRAGFHRRGRRDWFATSSPAVRSTPCETSPRPIRSSVFPDAIGLRKDGRENLLPYGNMAFNAFGPRNELFEASFADAQNVIGWIQAQCRREALDAGWDRCAGLQGGRRGGGQRRGSRPAGALVADRGSRHDDLRHWCRALLLCAVSRAMAGAARRSAEGARRVRGSDPLHFAGADLLPDHDDRPVEVAGVKIPADQKVMLFLAAANRDPRQWSEPDRFDIGRKTLGHVGFGYGIHACVGQMVARLEAEILLTALARSVGVDRARRRAGLAVEQHAARTRSAAGSAAALRLRFIARATRVTQRAAPPNPSASCRSQAIPGSASNSLCHCTASTTTGKLDRRQEQPDRQQCRVILGEPPLDRARCGAC